MRLMLVSLLFDVDALLEHTNAEQILSSAFLQGADAEELGRVYESESKLLEPWADSPGEVSTDDWRDYLGCREYVTQCDAVFLRVQRQTDGPRYQRAFVDYFEDELVRHAYDWKKVVAEYLFSGREPMFNAIIADRMSHPVRSTADELTKASRTPAHTSGLRI